MTEPIPNGNGRRVYTDEQKAEALALYIEHGPAEAGRQTGIAANTISQWASRDGRVTVTAARMAEAREQAKKRIDLRKLDLADVMLDDVFALRAQLWEPAVEKIVKTVATGEGTSATEIVKIEHDKPTFAAQALIQKAAALGVEKVQILTGAATERIETMTGAPDSEAADSLYDELAARRQAS